MNINNKTLAILLETISNNANEKIPADREDFELYDWAMQVDDAYELGEDTGRVKFARALMQILNSDDAQ